MKCKIQLYCAKKIEVLKVFINLPQTIGPMFVYELLKEHLFLKDPKILENW